jgi:hypothetical protein
MAHSALETTRGCDGHAACSAPARKEVISCFVLNDVCWPSLRFSRWLVDPPRRRRIREMRPRIVRTRPTRRRRTRLRSCSWRALHRARPMSFVWTRSRARRTLGVRRSTPAPTAGCAPPAAPAVRRFKRIVSCCLPTAQALPRATVSSRPSAATRELRAVRTKMATGSWGLATSDRSRRVARGRVCVRTTPHKSAA